MTNESNENKPKFDKTDRICAKQADFLLSLAKNHFNVSEACKEVGITRKIYKSWIKKNKRFKAKIEEIEDIFIDDAEQALRELVKEDKNFYAIKYLLDNLGKRRGWGKGAEVKQQRDHPVMLFHCENLLLGRDANGNKLPKEQDVCQNEGIIDVSAAIAKLEDKKE